MFFKNATLLRLPVGYTPPHPIDLSDALAAHPMREPGQLEMETRGFVPPLSVSEAATLPATNGCDLLTLGTASRLLPASVLREAMAARISEHEAKTGRKPGKRMRNEIREEVLGELLPRTFIKHSRTPAYIDRVARLLVVDTASDRAAEAVATAIREALGTFPVRPLATEASVSQAMTSWELSGELPDCFEFGDSVEFKRPNNQSSVVRCRNHDLTADEVREHARCGSQVSQLELVFDQRIAFTLDSQMKLRGIEFLDVVAEKLEAQDGASADDILAAEFFLQTEELRRLFAALDRLLVFVD